MSKMKHTKYTEFDDGDAMMDDDFNDSDIDIDAGDEELLVSPENVPAYKRSWRDTEKYKEIRELYKLINDELYTGINDSDFLENDY